MKAYSIMDGSDVMETYPTREEAEEVLRADAIENDERHIKEREISDQEYFQLLSEKAEIGDFHL